MFNRQINAGFSLLEILVAMAIVAILMATIAPNLIGSSDQARVVKAQQDVNTLSASLDVYRLDNGVYPSTAQGLKALVEKPSSAPVPKHWRSGGYIKKLPLDPWDNPYQYINPSKHGPGVDVFSYGPDGQAGGDGEEAADIGNW